MKTHGLLFKAEMIRAFLREESPKRQTRRLVTANNSLVDGFRARTMVGFQRWDILDWTTAKALPSGFIVMSKNGVSKHLVQPVIVAEDGFYAKETHATIFETGDKWTAGIAVRYAADDMIRRGDGRWQKAFTGKPKWTPSILMPRSASRITGTFKEIRGQFVQSISAEDAISEGIKIERGSGMIEGEACYMMTTNSGYMRGPLGAITAYRDLWDSINVEPGKRWSDNPPVWAYTLDVK